VNSLSLFSSLSLSLLSCIKSDDGDDD